MVLSSTYPIYPFEYPQSTRPWNLSGSKAQECPGGCCSLERLALGPSMLWDVDDVVDR